MKDIDKKTAIKQGILDGLLPTIYQFLILCVVILEFYFLIGHKSPLMISQVSSDINNDPNLIRFIYMFLALALAGILLFVSSRQTSIRKSFWLSLIGGILLWQAIGECSWHFGFEIAGENVYFPKIEGSQGTFMLVLIIPLLVYLMIKKIIPWFLLVFIASFMLNWLGHFVLIGIEPWFNGMIPWLKVGGYLIGGGGSLLLSYGILFKARTLEQRLMLSMLLYTCIGIMVEGVFGIGSSLE